MINQNFAPILNASIIPDGSFATQPEIHEAVTRILDMLPDESQIDLDRSYHKTKELELNLHLCIQNYALEVRSAPPLYEWYAYSTGLLLTDSEMLQVLENDVFNEPYSESLKSAFNDYFECMNLPHGSEIGAKFKIKLISELGLDAIIYTATSDLLNEKRFNKSHGFGPSSRDGIFGFISHCQSQGSRTLIFEASPLAGILSKEDFIEIMKIAGGIDIRAIEFRDSNIGHVLSFDDLLDIVKVAGASGVRTLKILNDILFRLCSFAEVLTLVERAGKSGIRFLNIRNSGYEPNSSYAQRCELEEIQSRYNIHVIYKR